MAAPENTLTCPRCGGPVMQFGPIQIGSMGVAMILIAGMMPLVNRWLLLPAVALALVGGWMLIWATVGKARWCRTCKIFP